MIRKLKNIDTVIHTYYGITIGVGEFYVIEQTDTLVLAEDEQLQTNIDENKIEVYIDTTKVLNTQDAIDVIKYGEIHTTTIGGIARSFIFDKTRNKWFSTETVVLSGSRNTVNVEGYLRTFDGLVMNDDLGYVAPWNGTIIAMSLSRTDTDSVTGQVYINGSSSSAAITTSSENSYVTNINQNFNAGDKLTFNITSGSADRPIIMAFIK